MDGQLSPIYRSRIGASVTSDGLPASLFALAMEKTELRQHFTDGEGMRMEIAIDTGRRRDWRNPISRVSSLPR